MNENQTPPNKAGSLWDRVKSIAWPAAAVVAILVSGFIASRVDHMLEEKLSSRPLQTIWSGNTLPAKLAKKGRAVYVPAYSNISSGGGTKTLLETTLSVRNTDPEHPIQINRISYLNSDGTRVKELADDPISLGPMQTASYLVKEQDDSGGLGANFMVEWSAQDTVNRPIIEAIMIGENGLSFVSRGEPIERR